MKPGLLLAVVGVGSIVIVGYFAYYTFRQTSLNVPGAPWQDQSKQVSPPSGLGEPLTLIYPGERASEQEKTKWQAYVISQAQTSDALSISGCKGVPQVIKTKPDSILKIDNQDSSALNIYMVDKVFSVPAKGSTAIKLDFVKNGDLTVYSCGTAGSPNGGILYISE